MSRTDIDWRAVAAEAERILADEPQGRRVAATVDAAKALKVGVQTLRRFLFAHRFLAKLPADVRDIAAELPAVAVATAARWYSHDKAGALDAVRNYATMYTVRSFEDAEAAARTARRGAGGARLAHDYAKQVKSRFANGFFETVWPLNPGSDAVDGRLVDRVDPTGKVEFFSAAARSGKAVAVMVVGPYATPRMYSERAADWCLRALGVCAVHGRAALVLPDQAPVAEFVAFLDGLPSDVTSPIEILRDTVAPGKRPSNSDFRRLRH